MALSCVFQALATNWAGRLSYFKGPQNPEHLEALFDEASRFAGLQLEADLAKSEFWGPAPLLRRAAVLLFLVDQGVVSRHFDSQGLAYEVHPTAESWVASQASLAAYVHPTYELLSALRHVQAKRFLGSNSV